MTQQWGPHVPKARPKAKVKGYADGGRVNKLPTRLPAPAAPTGPRKTMYDFDPVKAARWGGVESNYGPAVEAEVQPRPKSREQLAEPGIQADITKRFDDASGKMTGIQSKLDATPRNDYDARSRLHKDFMAAGAEHEAVNKDYQNTHTALRANRELAKFRNEPLNVQDMQTGIQGARDNPSVKTPAPDSLGFRKGGKVKKTIPIKGKRK
jgi:hypothetical protein